MRVLIDALTGERRLPDEMRRAVQRGHRLAVSALVLYEWRRGPRTELELAYEARLFPAGAIVAFGPD